MTLEALLNIEESFWESSGDQSFYETHVADEGRFVLSMGVMGKDDVVASMADARPWDSFDIRDASQIQISDDVVGLVYEATGQRAADADEYRANILSVYRSKGDEWELVLHQQTPVE